MSLLRWRLVALLCPSGLWRIAVRFDMLLADSVPQYDDRSVGAW